MTKKMNKNEKSSKKSNHNNRKYSILLLALLFIGVATYGTYAYFTDSKDVDGQLKLTKGTVKLGDVTSTDGWTYKGNTLTKDMKKDMQKDIQEDKNVNYPTRNPNFTAGSQITGNSASLVLPGDTFSKEAKISYEGTSQADLTITMNSVSGIDYTVQYSTDGGKSFTSLTSTSPAKFTTSDNKTSDNKTSDNNKTITFKLTAHVPAGGIENFVTKNDNTSTTDTASRNNTSTVSFANLENAVTITATQHLE